MKVKDKVFNVLHILTFVFFIIWSIVKYNLGVNKNYFFAQIAIIGTVMMTLTYIDRFLKNMKKEKTGTKDDDVKGLDKTFGNIIVYAVMVLVLITPSDFFLKDTYDSPRSLTNAVEFFNKVSGAYGNDELYYIKYYDFSGKYNDMLFEVKDGKYVLVENENLVYERYTGTEQTQGRMIDVNYYKTVNSTSAVLVVEQHTPDVPASVVKNNGQLLFTVAVKEDTPAYSVSLGVYEGEIEDINLTFDNWGVLKGSNLKKAE